MKSELIVIWETGEKEVHEYECMEEARAAEIGYKTAFGNQISWTGINNKNNTIELEKIYKVELEFFRDPLVMKAEDLNAVAVLLFNHANHNFDTGYPNLAARYKQDALKITRMLDADGYYDDL